MTSEGLSFATSIYLGLFVGGFVFAWLWEDGAPLRAWPDARTRRLHVLRNLGLLAAVIVFADLVVGRTLWPDSARLLAPGDGWLTPLGLPVAAQILVAFLVIELFEYGYHRLAHAWRPLWLLHAVHHADPHVDFSTSARHHPLETALVIALRLPIYLVLGLPLWIEAIRVTVVNTVLLLQHTNVAFPRWIESSRTWLATPAVHRVHHSPDAPRIDRNFGQILSCWDRMFGTYAEPVGEAPETYGLRKLAAERWQTLAGMLLTPITARRVPGPL